MRIRHAMAATLATATLTVGMFAGTAGAQETPSSSSSDHPAIEALCARIPRVEDRLQRHRERILADASTVGSAAWLHAQADKARADGHPVVADRLDLRGDRRAARVPVIDARLEALDKAQTACTNAGVG